MIFEGLKKKGSIIIVPSTEVESMGLGALGGMTAFDRIMAKQKEPTELGYGTFPHKRSEGVHALKKALLKLLSS
jgi:hypothetical protein